MMHERSRLGWLLLIAAAGCSSKKADPPATKVAPAEPAVVAPADAAVTADSAVPGDAPGPSADLTPLKLGGRHRTAAMEVLVPAGFTVEVPALREDLRNIDDLAVTVSGPGVSFFVEPLLEELTLEQELARLAAHGATVLRKEELGVTFTVVSKEAYTDVKVVDNNLRMSCWSSSADADEALRAIPYCESLRYTGGGPATGTPPDGKTLLKRLKALKDPVMPAGCAPDDEPLIGIPTLLKRWQKDMSNERRATIETTCRDEYGRPGGPWMCTTAVSSPTEPTEEDDESEGSSMQILFMVAADGSILDLVGCVAAG